MSKGTGVVNAFDRAAFVTSVAGSTHTLGEASRNGNTAQVISSLASIAAALPGPQKLGMALTNFGLSPLPVGDSYVATRKVTLPQVMGITLAGASLVVAAASAVGVTTIMGIPIAIVGGAVAIGAVLNEIFPDKAEGFYDKVAEVFVSVASGAMP